MSDKPKSIIAKMPKGMVLSQITSPGFDYKEDSHAKAIEALEARLAAVEAKLAEIKKMQS